MGIFEGNFIHSDSYLEGLLSLSSSALPKVLFYTHQNHLSATHLSLDDSISLYYAVFPTQFFAQEVHVTDSSIPCNVKEALSPAFVDEWGAAIDHGNAGFITHSCFEPVTLQSNVKVLPGIWIFTCKRDNSAKA